MTDYIKIDERKYWLKCLVNDILGDDGLCEGCKYVDHGSCYKCRRTGANEILKIIDTDVAPVVRCKNCKWMEKNASGDMYCNYRYGGVKPYDFCSYGEKMDEENKDVE